MKTKKYILLLLALVNATLLLSWSMSGNSKKEITTPLNSYLYNLNLHGLSDADMSAYFADKAWEFSPGSNSKTPPAEDVLVQKIPGDNNHLLLMAYYSKENFSDPFFIVNNNGLQLAFRDDGKGYDKIAGDGLYTTKIVEDVTAFRRNAMAMAAEMKKNGYNPYRFVNREIVYDPNASDDFDDKQFDNNQAVSISSLSTSTSNKAIDSLRTHSIFITDLKVVEDSTRTWNPCTLKGNLDGPWTFKTLIKNLASADAQHMANDSTISSFVKSWLNSWSTDKVIHGDTVKARTLVKTKILNPWLTKSQNAGSPQGQLDMRFAPFKLLAIVNRFDLRERDFAQGLNAGEARFIFCLINSDCNDKEDFTVIFEYKSPVINNCDSIRAWAQRWFDLKKFDVGSAAYDSALNVITDKFSLVGPSTLDALRTNDRALSPAPTRTELRQFALNNNSHKLFETTISLAPADKYNAQVDNPDVQLMVSWINSNRRDIINDSYQVPVFFVDSLTNDTTFFQAGKTTILDTPVGTPPGEYHWDGNPVKGTKSFIRNTTTRHTFSLNICSGCHAGETQTFFFHVEPVFFQTQTTLSGFLTGNPQPEAIPFDMDGNPTNDSMMAMDAAHRPQANPLIYFFDDILRRARDLKDFISTPCGTTLQIRDQLMTRTMHAAH